MRQISRSNVRIVEVQKLVIEFQDDEIDILRQICQVKIQQGFAIRGAGKFLSDLEFIINNPDKNPVAKL
jgi:hypothetical protein